MQRLAWRRAIGAGLGAILGGAALADDPVTWNIDLSTSGQDVFWTSPTAVAPAADQYDASYVISRVDATVRFLIFTVTVDVTNEIPPELLSGNNSVLGPAPILLADQMIVFPEPPEPAGVAGSLRIELNASGFGEASFTDVTLGTLVVDVPGFGTQTVQLLGLRIIGDVTVKAVDIGLPGDMNCDGAVSVGDIGSFVLALTNPAEYALQFPNCPISNADLSGDGAVTVSDIGPFVALLTGL